MGRVATFAVSLTALALTMCPVAQAEPTLDDWYSKALSGNLVNYQGRASFEEMISLGQSVCSALDRSPGHSTFVSAVNNIVAKGVFNPTEARGIASSAVAAYCPNHNDSNFG